MKRWQRPLGTMRIPSVPNYRALHDYCWASRGHLWYHAKLGWGINGTAAILATCRAQFRSDVCHTGLPHHYDADDECVYCGKTWREEHAAGTR